MKVRKDPFIPKIIKKTDQPFAISGPEIMRQSINIGMSIAYDIGEIDLLFIGVLDASFVFMADVLRMIHRPCEMGFMKATSFHGQVAGHLSVTQPGFPVKDRTIVLMDTILDSGQTLHACTETLKELGAGDIYTAVMFQKEGEREFKIEPDYAGFIIPDVFVVGYGLDLDQHYRGLPHLMDINHPDIPK